MDEAKCAKCGTPAAPDARFCESCGAPFVEGRVQVTPDPLAKAVKPPTQPQAQQYQEPQAQALRVQTQQYEQPTQGHQQPQAQQYQQPPAQQYQQPMQGVMRVDRKKPWLAALLGILIVGLGHMYLGMWAKGIGLLVVGVVASILSGAILAPVFWIISCVWAYFDAKAYNRKAGYPE